MDKAVRIEEVEFALAKQKKLLNTVKLTNLPDKGEKLKKRVDDLEKELEKLTLGSSSSSSTENRSSSNSSAVDQIKKDESKTKSSVLFEKNVRVSPIGSALLSSKTGLEKVQQNKEAGSAFVKDFTSDLPSFEQLNVKGVVNEKKQDELYQSPSFKTHRSTSNFPLRLTEAKPLLEDKTHKKGFNKFYSSIQPNYTPNEEAVQKLHDCLSVYPEDSEEVTPPNLLQTSLLPHQVSALSWMLWRESQILSGGILADDMGLGKTLTVISLILKQKESKNFLGKKAEKATCATLVVCLSSILHQWSHEIRKHCQDGAFNILMYHGSKRELPDDDYADIVLTTYSIVQNERKSLINKKKESPLFNRKWERIILDEAHTIRNHTSLTAEAIYALDGYRRWCVSGTPIHNDVKDLYSLIKFLRLSPFDEHTKWKKLMSDSTSASKDRIALLVKSIVFRRTKGEKDKAGKYLVKMKKKEIIKIYFELSEEERKVYLEINEAAKNYITKSPTKLNNTSNLLVMMLRLQQCCSHLGLLGQTLEDSSAESSCDDLCKAVSSLALGDSPSRSHSDSSLNISFSSYSSVGSTFQSTKLRRLLEKLREISEQSDGKDKSVIVSQWVSMLEIVGKHLDREKMCYFRISGDTKTEDRQKYADSFNSNPKSCNIMLLSLKAGGVGLNLDGANHLFLLDLHWNPALEMQACDRIHRVGQTKNVSIYKFICKNSIEEKILELQTKKSEEASGVYEGGSKMKKGLSREDFKLLFNVRF